MTSMNSDVQTHAYTQSSTPSSVGSNETSASSSTETSAESTIESSETWTSPLTAKEILDQHTAHISQLASDQVSISPRAEKIQMLNDEFFPSGPSSVKITPDFIQRLNEYELISDADAQKFLNQLDSKPSGTTNTLGQISSFIEIFQEELAAIDEEHPLLATLSEAKSIVDDMASGHASYSSEEIGSVMNTLKAFQESEEGQALSKEHQDALQEVQDILAIIQQFNSGQSSNDATKQYASVFSQSFG